MNSRRHLIKPREKTPAKRHKTHDAAVAAARNCGAPNVAVDSFLLAGKYLGVVLLRKDQAWMAEHIEERGVMTHDIDTWMPSGRMVK